MIWLDKSGSYASLVPKPDKSDGSQSQARSCQVALQGPIPVEFGAVFPSGAYAAGAFEPVRNFDASTGEKFVQSSDKASGLPLWVIEVIDTDPAARTRAVKVKVAAQVQPVIPAGSPGSPFTPVEFTGMSVTPYVNQAGRRAYSVKATGIRAPGRGRPGGEAREVAA